MNEQEKFLYRFARLSKERQIEYLLVTLHRSLGYQGERAFKLADSEKFTKEKAAELVRDIEGMAIDARELLSVIEATDKSPRPTRLKDLDELIGPARNTNIPKGQKLIILDQIASFCLHQYAASMMAMNFRSNNFDLAQYFKDIPTRLEKFAEHIREYAAKWIG